MGAIDQTPLLALGNSARNTSLVWGSISFPPQSSMYVASQTGVRGRITRWRSLSKRIRAHLLQLNLELGLPGVTASTISSLSSRERAGRGRLRARWNTCASGRRPVS